MQLDVYPNGIKQQHLERVDTPVSFEIDSSVPLRYQFITRLERLLHFSEEAQKAFHPLGKQLGISHYVLRPSLKTGDGFEEKPWSTSEWAVPLPIWLVVGPVWLIAPGVPATSQLWPPISLVACSFISPLAGDGSLVHALGP